MPKPTSLSALIKSQSQKPAATAKTKAPLRAAAAAPLPGPAAPNTKSSTGTMKTTIVYYPWDIETIEEAQRYLRQSGRKAERTFTVRALMHSAPLNDALVQKYDELEKLDARRGPMAGREGKP